MLSHFSHVRLFVTARTVALQAPLSLGFSRQEYCSGLPFPSPGDLPDAGIEPPGLLHCRQILYHLIHQGSPRIPPKFSILSLSAHSRCEGGRSIFGPPLMAHPDLWLNPTPSLVAMGTGWKKDAILCLGDVWQYLGACTMPTLGAKRWELHMLRWKELPAVR